MRLGRCRAVCEEQVYQNGRGNASGNVGRGLETSLCGVTAAANPEAREAAEELRYALRPPTASVARGDGRASRAMRGALFGDAGFAQGSASTNTLLFIGIERLLRDCLIVPVIDWGPEPDAV